MSENKIKTYVNIPKDVTSLDGLMVKVGFGVSLSKEERDAGNTEQVETTISFVEGDLVELVKAGIKSHVIAIQANLKSHWDEFMKEGVSSELAFGERPFENKRAAPITEAKASDFLAKMLEGLSPEEKIAKLKELGIM